VEPHSDRRLGPDDAHGDAMVGYGARKAGSRCVVLLVLPLILSTAFLFIADIDSPRGGIIHVVPQNLLTLTGTLH
jgi:hypothetical protein